MKHVKKLLFLLLSITLLGACTTPNGLHKQGHRKNSRNQAAYHKNIRNHTRIETE